MFYALNLFDLKDDDPNGLLPVSWTPRRGV